MNTEILVLGAMGNVGAAVVDCLLAMGQNLRAAGSSPEKIKNRFGQGLEAVQFDFTRPETFEPAFRGIKRLFLMRPPQIADIKHQMVPALEAARKAGVRHITFLSLIGIEQKTIVPHYQVEQWLRHSGLEWTFLRCGFFMQNLNTTHLAEIRDHDEIFIPVAKAKTNFIDVRDIGAVAALTLTESSHVNQAYDLTGNESLDYYQVAALFSQILGRSIVYRSPSSGAFFRRQLKNHQPLMFALVSTWLYSDTKKGMADVASNEVQRLLGHPPITMRQYITDYRKDWERP